MREITACEEEVLLSIFKLNPDEAALQQIWSMVNEEFKHEWKPQTVSTFLARLVRKNYLTMIRRGRHCCYTPAMSLEEYRLQNMKERLEVLFDGDVEACQTCLEMMRSAL